MGLKKGSVPMKPEKMIEKLQAYDFTPSQINRLRVFSAGSSSTMVYKAALNAVTKRGMTPVQVMELVSTSMEKIEAVLGPTEEV